MDLFCFELSKLFVNSGTTDIVLVTLSSTAVETATAQCTSRWAMARGHRLNTSIVLAVVHGLSGLFRTVSAVEHSLCRPLPSLSPSLIGHLASVDVKQHESRKGRKKEDRYHTNKKRHKNRDLDHLGPLLPEREGIIPLGNILFWRMYVIIY